MFSYEQGIYSGVLEMNETMSLDIDRLHEIVP